MAARLEREKSKMQNKYQMILSEMLKEDNNKYCVDCDTKHPRWSSWNIGVFVCIRCAGLHRNLGVHISKVKSVNLDSWTAKQIASVQVMGNSRARAVYEANLPDGFRRPQTDLALESFIRAKYEQRKWIAKEWIPSEITLMESETHEKQVEAMPNTDRVEKKVLKLKLFAIPVTQQTLSSSSLPNTTTIEEKNTENLLNFDESSSILITNSSTTVASSNITTTSHNKTKINTDMTNINQDLVDAFSFSNEISTNSNEMMSNEKILALFDTPQISTSVQKPYLSSSDFVYPSTQQSHSLVHQKFLSFGNNLSQQATNFESESGINHRQLNGINGLTLQNPTLAQLKNQSMSFTNTKSNISTPTNCH